MRASMTRFAFERAGRTKGGHALSVLIFHRVPQSADELLTNEPDAATFERMLRWLRETFNVLPLERAVADLKAARLPPRAAAITFDDGYANNATVAAPILERLGMHATFFVATGYLDGGCMFNDVVVESLRQCRAQQLDLQGLGLGVHTLMSAADRRRAIDAILRVVKYLPDLERRSSVERIAERCGAELPRDLMMTSEQVAGLHRRGFGLGGHTVTHPILARADLAAASREVLEGRRRLEDLAGVPIRLFAYPNGRPNSDYTAATVRLVRELGFEGAMSTSMGVARTGDDPFQIPRFTPWDARPLHFAVQMWRNVKRGRGQYADT